MGFIKHALIGIALYEAVKYILKKEDPELELAHEGIRWEAAVNQHLRREEVDVIAGARQTDQLDRMKQNADNDELVGGTDPKAPLTGKEPEKDDPWKNSLANDDLRAPDS
jgi:hypothetical protein